MSSQTTLTYIVCIHHNRAPVTRTLAKQPLSVRARPGAIERLRQRARQTGQTQAALAERYIEEGLRRDEHPLITFRDALGGRRPALVGTRLDVWQVIETLRQNEDSLAETAEYLEIPPQHVRACLRYYSDFKSEIDEWTERARWISQREGELWQREQTILG